MTDRYTNLIQARCQPGFAALVEKAAQLRGMSHSEWIRQAARVALQLDGIDPAEIATHKTKASQESSLGDTGAIANDVQGLTDGTV